jgi:hypothetical protein
MTGDQTKNLINALDTAGIKNYEFRTDMMTHYYNNGDNAIIKYNEADQMVYNIRSNSRGGYVKSNNGGFEIAGTWCEDIHEVIFNANYDQVASLMSNLGVELSTDETKLLININTTNYDINPQTGDYVSGFHYLPPKEVEKLSPEEREKYEADKAAYEKAKREYLAPNQSASITVG